MMKSSIEAFKKGIEGAKKLKYPLAMSAAFFAIDVTGQVGDTIQGNDTELSQLSINSSESIVSNIEEIRKEIENLKDEIGGVDNLKDLEKLKTPEKIEELKIQIDLLIIEMEKFSKKNDPELAETLLLQNDILKLKAQIKGLSLYYDFRKKDLSPDYPEKDEEMKEIIAKMNENDEELKRIANDSYGITNYKVIRPDRELDLSQMENHQNLLGPSHQINPSDMYANHSFFENSEDATGRLDGNTKIFNTEFGLAQQGKLGEKFKYSTNASLGFHSTLDDKDTTVEKRSNRYGITIGANGGIYYTEFKNIDLGVNTGMRFPINANSHNSGNIGIDLKRYWKDAKQISQLSTGIKFTKGIASFETQEKSLEILRKKGIIDGDNFVNLETLETPIEKENFYLILQHLVNVSDKLRLRARIDFINRSKQYNGSVEQLGASGTINDTTVQLDNIITPIDAKVNSLRMPISVGADYNFGKGFIGSANLSYGNRSGATFGQNLGFNVGVTYKIPVKRKQ